MDGSGVTQDQPQAMAWHHQSADQKPAGAQRMLGVMYEYGLGVLHHGEQAMAWYRKSAEQGAASVPTRISALHHAW
jgi:TPR repeat protein